MTQSMELVAQGAEARLYKGIYLGKACLVKERFVKKYRLPELDARLTKDRIRAEARAIIRAKSAGIALYIYIYIYTKQLQSAKILRRGASMRASLFTARRVHLFLLIVVIVRRLSACLPNSQPSFSSV